MSDLDSNADTTFPKLLTSLWKLDNNVVPGAEGTSGVEGR